VQQVWKDVYPFGDYANLQPVPDFNYTYPTHAIASKLKLVSTGHGWGNLNTGNAAEFYNATHNIFVNGTSTFSQNNWKTCNPNPDACSPQNGTWTYNRAGWCPGSIAPYFDYDMTPYVAAQNVSLDYEFFTGYTDQCHPNNPACVTGTTCADCTDGFNPVLDVNCNLIVFYDEAITLDVKNETDFIGFALFPNPSAGTVTINSYGKSKQNYTVTVYNMVGGLMKEFSWDGERKSVDFSSFAKGIYNVKVSNGKVNEFRKLVIE
jgi:hypothetical protein